MDDVVIRSCVEGVRLRVRVKPRASRSRVLGVREGSLEVAVAAPPVEGQANAELVAFLAKTLSVAKSSVELVGGETARVKTLVVRGVDAEKVLSILGVSK